MTRMTLEPGRQGDDLLDDRFSPVAAWPGGAAGHRVPAKFPGRSCASHIVGQGAEG